MTPQQRIMLAGDVLIDSIGDYRDPDAPQAHWVVATDDLKKMRSTGRYDEAHECTAVCRALLATPGVIGVIINPSHGGMYGISRYAVRYQRSTTGKCGIESGNSWDHRNIPTDGLLEPALESCVVAGPAPPRYDLVIRRISGTMFAEGARGDEPMLGVNLLPRPVAFLRTEIADAQGRLLLRRTVAPASVAVPLISPMRIGLLRPTNDVEVDAGPASVSVDRILLASTNVRRERR